MEVALFALVTYVVLDTLFLLYAIVRRVRFGRFRGTCLGVAYVALLVVWLLLSAQTGTVLT